MEHAEDEVIVGELIDDDGRPEVSYFDTPVEPGHAVIALAALAVVAMFLLLILQNFVFDSVEQPEGPQGDYERVPVWERGNWPYITNGSYSHVMEFGPYSLSATDNEWNSTHQFVEFTLPLAEGGSAPNGLVSLAYWLPDVPEGVQVPMIAEFGPYFDEQSVSTPSIEVPGTWLGQMIICLLYTSPSPRDGLLSRMPSSA